MRIWERAIAATVSAALLCLSGVAMVAPAAAAHDMDEVVERSGHLQEVRRFVGLHERLDALLARYARLEAHAGRAWLRLMEAERAVAGAASDVQEAEVRQDRRVRTAYQFGPGGTLEALLATMERKVDRAAQLAVEAHLERELEEQRRAIAELAARQGSWDLGVIGYGEDQSHLLSLLGPTGGRTCETPEGLVETGTGFSGYASWYGWEFGGQPTATGAIFDPRLFTPANRWLPFGTFLRVRHAGRCAIVLVNDRGPFGREERVIDLSMPPLSTSASGCRGSTSRSCSRPRACPSGSRAVG